MEFSKSVCVAISMRPIFSSFGMDNFNAFTVTTSGTGRNCRRRRRCCCCCCCCCCSVLKEARSNSLQSIQVYGIHNETVKRTDRFCLFGQLLCINGFSGHSIAGSISNSLSASTFLLSLLHRDDFLRFFNHISPVIV